MGLTKRLELESTGDRGILLIPVQARAVYSKKTIRSHENNSESETIRDTRTISR